MIGSFYLRTIHSGELRSPSLMLARCYAFLVVWARRRKTRRLAVVIPGVRSAFTEFAQTWTDATLVAAMNCLLVFVSEGVVPDDIMANRSAYLSPSQRVVLTLPQTTCGYNFGASIYPSIWVG